MAEKKKTKEQEKLRNPAVFDKAVKDYLKESAKKIEKENKVIEKKFGNDTGSSSRKGNIESSPARRKSEPIVFDTKEDVDAYVNSLAKQTHKDLKNPTNFNSAVKVNAVLFNREKNTPSSENSPYRNMDYRAMTDDIHNTYGGELRRGNIDQNTYYKERAKYDTERILKANKEELKELLEEKSSEREYLMFQVQFTGTEEQRQNSLSAKNRLQELDVLQAEINSRIADIELEEKYDNTLLDFGRIAVKSGASDEYSMPKSGFYTEEGTPAPDAASPRADTHDFINYYKAGKLNEDEIKTASGQISNLIFLTDGEVKLYNTLFNNNPKDARRFLKEMEGTLNKRLAEYQREKALEYGQKHPYLAGLKSVAENVTMGLPAAVDNIVEGVTGKVDTYDSTSRILRESQALRQGGSDYFNQKYGKTGGFLYNTGLSIVENLANVFLFKGAGKVASGLVAVNMAGNAATTGMIDVADRGGSDFQIITSGIANGAAEYLFEKFSVEKLFNIKGARNVGDFIKKTLAQSGIEASEEIFTETANILTDAIIMQEKSENVMKLRNYIMQGMSYEEASKKVFHESITEIALAGASGLVSGGVMGGGATLLNNASRTNYMTTVGGDMITKTPQVFQDIVKFGIENNNTDAIRTAENMFDGNIDGKTAGKVITSVIEQSVENNGGIMNIMQLIGKIEGRGSSYIGSMESINTAKSVMHMVQGKMTDTDRAIISRSDGAVTLLTAIEGNEKAWNSVKEAAGRELRSAPQMQNNEDVRTWTDNTNNATVSDGEIYSDGKKLSIPEKVRQANNIILDENSSEFRNKDAKGYKVVETLAKDLKKKVKFVKGLTDADGNQLDGAITEDGIYINTEGENPVRWASTHEFSHAMKQSATESWSRYQNYVVSQMKRNGSYESVFAAKAKAYGTADANYINEEIAADYIGDLFSDVDSLADCIRESRRDAVTIRDMWYSILDKLGLLGEKKKAQLMWRNAYREAVLNVKDGKVENKGEPRFKIVTMSDGSGRKYVHATQRVIKSKNPDMWESEIMDYVNKVVRKGEDVVIPLDNEESIVITGRTAWKLGDKGEMPNKFYLVKGNASGVINEIIGVSKSIKSAPSYKEHSNDFAKYGFDYRRAYFMDIDGKYYELTLSVGINQEGKEAYNIGYIKRKPFPVTGSKARSTTLYGKASSTPIVSQDNSGVNTNSTQNGENNTQKSISGTRTSEILSAENVELKKQLENLQIQLNQTEGKGVNVKEIKRAAQNLRKTYGSKIRLSELHQDLTKLYTLMSSNKATADEVSQRISVIADKVVNKMTQTVTNDEYADLLDRIKNARIMVPELEKADFRDGYETFRKRNMGKVTLVNDGTDLDVFWDELTEEYPNLFDEDILGSEERLERILEVRDEFAPREESVFANDTGKHEAQLKLENEIMETFFDIPEGESDTKYVFYDKRAEVLETELDKMNKNVERAEEKVLKMRDKYNREKVSKNIDRVFGFLFNMTENPTNNRHVPEKLKKDVEGFVNRFIYETKIVGKKDPKETKVIISVRLDNIGTTYEKIVRKAWEDSPLLGERLGEEFEEFLSEIPEDVSGNFKRLDDMTTSELATISDMLTGIHHAITQSNKLFSENIKATKSEASDNVEREMEETRSKRKGNGERWVHSKEKGLYRAYNWMNNFVNAELLQPWDMFHRIGGTMEKLFGEARKAFNKHIKNLKTAKKVIKKAVGKLNIKELTGKNEKDYTFEVLGGEKIKLYKGQILSLYALYKRPQGRQHIESGGIVTERIVLNEEGKITGGPIHLAYQDLEKILKVLSDAEIKMVDDIVEFMSKTCAEWGNEASMKLFGFEKYGENWYFPIKVWDGSVSKEGKKKGDKKLTGQSFTKELVKDAGNAVVLDDFFDTVLNHIIGMSLYNTVALPILDTERVLNHTTDESTVRRARHAIEKTYGSNVVNYLYNWMTEVNGNKQAIQRDEGLDTLFRNTTKAKIAFKLSVLMKQFTSIIRAYQVINPQHLLTAINATIHPKKTIAEMQEHIPIAYYKGLGFRNPYTSRDIKTAILDMEPLSDKAAFGLYGMADDYTWGVIYTAVKREIKSDIKKGKLDIEIGSETYWEKVNERFDYVIDRTQVVDSVFHRSQIMRSESDWKKANTLFMSESIKSLNMYRTEIQDGIRNETKFKSFSRATAVFLANTAFLAAVSGFPMTLKDDEDDYYDEDEDKYYDGVGKRFSFWKDRYFGHFIDSAIDEVNVLKMFPYIKTVFDIMEGWEKKDIIWEDIQNALKLIKNVVNGNGKVWVRNMYDVSSAVGTVFGMPYGNALKEVESIAMTIMHQVGDEYVDYLMAKSKWNVKNPDNESKFMKYYEFAIANGHGEDAATILADYMAETYKGQKSNPKHTETVIGEMSKLYGKTDFDSKLLYDVPSEKFSFDGEKYTIPDAEYPEYVSGAYKTLFDLAYEMVMDERYKELSDEDKVRSFGELKEYSQHAQRMEQVEGYELSGWEKELYDGKIDFMDSVVERVADREFFDKKEAYIDGLNFDESKYTEAEIGTVEAVGNKWAGYKASKDLGREIDESEYRHIIVYENKLSDEMPLEEYAGIRAYAKKTAALYDLNDDNSDEGSESMSSKELERYLDSTDYSWAVKGALFEAIGNSNWYNKYYGKKNNGEPLKGRGGSSGSGGGSSKKSRTGITNRASGISRTTTRGTSGTKGTTGTRGTSGTKGTR